MAKLHPITLVDQVVEELGRLIRKRNPDGNAELPSISELADRFGVSKVVVREALKSLEAQGAVEILNGRRARIAPVSTRPLVSFFAWAVDLDGSSVDELVQIRATLEIEAAGMAAVNRTDVELEAMREIARKWSAESVDRLSFRKLDEAFHSVIHQATHNRMLISLVGSLRDTMLKVQGNRADSRGAAISQGAHVRLNDQLLDAISRRDSVAARRAMELHVRTSESREAERAPAVTHDRIRVPTL